MNLILGELLELTYIIACLLWYIGNVTLCFPKYRIGLYSTLYLIDIESCIFCTVVCTLNGLILINS